ncbi:MAG: hypothetical protein J5966_02670, partial [Lachnospiraceae bacterium]|nr:hypothetical protein [Lachnospiraceae bacterium]
EKLNRVMALCDLSNIRLSQLLNVDASLISRFRSGLRTPKSNPGMALRLTEILWQRIRSIGREAELSEIISPEHGEIDEKAFYTWLCNFDTISDNASLSVEKLISTFDMLSSNPSEIADISEPDNTYAAAIPEDVGRSIYRGIEGFRDSVIRLLKSAASSDAKELLLYSDENMDWMVADLSFRSMWASLMVKCIKKKIRIRIIHNVDRDFSEMCEAIISWLPLYMSGMIESYFCKKPNGKRFSHTIFLCPSIACIEAFHVIGSENEGIYHYYTDESLLRACGNAYEMLLNASLPLVRVAEPAFRVSPKGDITVIQNSLSVATMPREVAESFDSPSLMKEWQYRQAAFHNSIKEDHVYECIPLPSFDNVPAEAAAVEALPDTGTLLYSQKQYAAHIRNIIELLKNHPSYIFYPLSENPFPNVKIIVGSDYIKVTSTVQPRFSLIFTNPMMYEAFRKYVDKLTDHCSINRSELIKQLAAVCPSDDTA